MMHFRFEVPLEVSVDEAWAGVTDLAVLATCFPGAQLGAPTENGGRGSVTISLGPIRFEYDGDVVFVAKDEGEHKAVIDIAASDKSGGGSVSARIALAVQRPRVAEGPSSVLTLEADVDVSGRAAQFGRGMLEDVAHTLLSNFARRLEAYYRGEQVDNGAASTDSLNALSLIPKKQAAIAVAGVLAVVLVGTLVYRSMASSRARR
ncbi:SRPBCC family protein [Georgenia thermotolerans]|nr:SRPBCC family protein [Georgenia thermotolerans]